jgi:hypothetical protein
MAWQQRTKALTAAVAHIFGLMKAQSLPHSVLVTCMVGATPSKMGMEMLGRWPGLVTQVAPTADVMARVQLCAWQPAQQGAHTGRHDGSRVRQQQRRGVKLSGTPLKLYMPCTQCCFTAPLQLPDGPSYQPITHNGAPSWVLPPP